MSETGTPLANRRKDGWTWAKEIVGTMIGVVGVLVIPASWLYTTIDSLKMQSEVHTLKIQSLEKAQGSQERTNERIVERVDKVLEAVNDVRVQQARATAGLTK